MGWTYCTNAYINIDIKNKISAIKQTINIEKKTRMKNAAIRLN